MDLAKKFHTHWTNLALPSNGEPFLVAVSGGKDSMALAWIMHQLSIPIALAHCNFQLRGHESDLDEQLVKTWAALRAIPFHSIRFDTTGTMAAEKKGVQETARMLRYEWFQTLCNEHHYRYLVTAHHAHDNAETLLINLCKGTGLAGLHGIPEKSAGIIRPLLFATRQEIDDFITQQNIPYREDRSNAETKYLRNAVRHKILPVLDEVFPGVVHRLNENIQRFAGAEIIYREAIAQKKKKLLERRGADYYIPILKLQKEKAIETICFELLSDFGFSAAQAPELVKLLKSEPGHYISSASHKVIRDRMFLVITRLDTIKADLLQIKELPCTIETTEGRFRCRLVEPHTVKYSEATDLAFIDAGKIRLPLTLRRRRTGDYFYPLGMGMKKKKVSRYLIDQKIPLNEKEQVWIVENDKQVVWLAGFRLDERFKLKSSTKKILEIQFFRK